MKYGLIGLLLLTAAPAALAAENPPIIPGRCEYQLPQDANDMYLGEVSGVATNSKGHVFVFHRGNTNGPAYGGRAAQLLEFNENGTFVREIGHNLYAWSFAHMVRVDKDDNIWVADKGSDMVIKFNPEGRVVFALGRKPEASDEGAHRSSIPIRRCPQSNGLFRQVTDMAWDPQGNTYISDGYINSRVAKYDKDGNWVMQWGDRGTEPGKMNTPHSIANDAPGQHLCRRPRQQAHSGVQWHRARCSGSFLSMSMPLRVRSALIGNMPNLNAPVKTQNPGGALGGLHYTGTGYAVSLRLGRFPGPHLQADARRQAARRDRRRRTHAGQVRLDSWHRVPVGEYALCGRAPELAGAEADAPSRPGAAGIGAVKIGS